MILAPRFRPAPRRPDPVFLAWIGGTILAVIAYIIGPERLVVLAFSAFQRASWFFDQFFHGLTAAMREGLRAAAIGLYGTFVGLTLIGVRRGVPGFARLIAVSVVFLLLVWSAAGDGTAANARWAAALIIAALAALNATRRFGFSAGSRR